MEMAPIAPMARERHNPPPPSSNKNYERRVLREEMQELFDKAIKNCFPDLPGELFWVSPLRLLGQEFQEKYGEKYGDHICMNVFTICEGLRKLDPNLFRKRKSREIAKLLSQALEKENEECKMLQRFVLHGAGYITFEFSMQWMTHRIKTMLTAGIDTWAPVNVKSAVVTMPRKATNMDWRSSYIDSMLMNILDYAGVARGRPDSIDLEVAKDLNECFIRDNGEFISRRNGAHLFAVKDTALASDFSFNDVFLDLVDLWSIIHIQRVQLIVFVTPAPLQAYVQKLFAAAKNEEWLPKYPLLDSCGYRASSASDDSKMLRLVWDQFERYPSLVKLGEAAGYSASTFFASAVTYTYLKNHRLAICTFNFDEMFDEEGDTLVYLLKTRAIFASRMGNLCSRGMVNYAKEFSRKERELAVHLVQFTEVVNRACLMLHPHLVCEYTWTLCKKFRSYYKVLKCMDLKVYESKLFLCDATEVVMKKCFDLLGISPESPPLFEFIPDGFIPAADREDKQVIPLPLSFARPIKTNPRFEMFSMNVHVKHSSFKMGDVFGIVSLIDTDGVLADTRLPLYDNGNGHVTYYYRNWYEASSIKNDGIVHFGNPRPGYSAPFTKILEVYLRLYATTIDSDQCFLLCMSRFPIDMSKFWDAKLDYERSSLVFKVKDGPLPLQRSVLAVPANGTLIIEALFFDVETGEVILRSKDKLEPMPKGSSECCMPWRSCFFSLIVKWNQGPKSSYV